MKPRKLFPAVVGTAVVAVLAVLVFSPDGGPSGPVQHDGATSVVPNFAGLQGSAPFVPMMSQVGACSELMTANNLTGAASTTRLTDLTTWFKHFHNDSASSFLLGHDCQGSSPTTLSSKLAGYGAWSSNYRNGSYISQADTGDAESAEAGQVEAQDPLAISTFWPGQYLRNATPASVAMLTAPLTATATTVKLSASGDGRPDGAATTWPYFASRGTGAAAGATSANTHDVVSWVRVENEMLQVTAVTESAGVVTLTVRRGAFGTTAASHVSASRVLSPVYVGSNTVNVANQIYNGAPLVDSTASPLRYGLKIWTPGAQDFIARRIQETFGDGANDMGGYNAVWLDVSSCGFFNQAGSDGSSVIPYDDRNAGAFTNDAYGDAELSKFAGLRSRLPGIKIVANNLVAVGAVTDCNNRLLSSGAVDGGVLENWMDWTPDGFNTPWDTVMTQNLAIQQNNWPAIYWVRWDNHDGDPAQLRRFAYGSLLLANKPTATRFQFGGPFGLNRPDNLYFWNWGRPLGDAMGTDDLELSNGLFRRDFLNGSVLVNPTTSPVTMSLVGTFYNVLAPDTAGDPSAVTSVTVPAQDAVFLLRDVAPADTTAAATTVVDPDAAATLVSGMNVSITGTATDATGIASVKVAMQNTDTGDWVHLGSKNGAYAAYDATLAAPGTKRSAWSAPFGSLPAGNYKLRVTTTDALGNLGVGPAQAFVVASDTQAPTASVSTPAAGAAVRVGASVWINGPATDDVGVTSATVTVKNVTTAMILQADGTWATTTAAVPINLASPGAASTTFSFTFTPPSAGQYSIAVKVKDPSKNTGSAAVIKVNAS